MYSYNEDTHEITLIRGDTLIMKVNIKFQDEDYVLQEGDVVRFAMKHKYKDPDDKVLINKVIPNDNLLLVIKPEDTKELKMRKRYVWDIELTDRYGRKDTFLTGTLMLKEEVC